MQVFNSIAVKVFCLLGVILFHGLAHAKKIEHLEPAYWWVGMKHPTVQLMINGENVSRAQPYIDYPGISINSTHRLSNANYLFIDLGISAQAKAGRFDIQFSWSDGTVLSYTYELKQRRAGSSQRQGFSQKDVIYLITPDRFANGNTDNDIVAEYADKLDRENISGRHGGDIQGIIDRLDYLHDLGVTQLWLMPVLENKQASYSYHGYSTTNYYRVDPRFGSNALYQSLSVKAKENGMGLIMDVILNHIGSGHWWMQDLPSRDWINHNGQYSPTNHRREALHDPHGVEEDARGFDQGWFVKTMPDLNQRNPFLAQYLIQHAIWWVEFAELSGIRVDTYPYSDKAFLSQWTKRLMLEYPNLTITGEEWTTNPAMLAYWQRGSQRYDDYQSYLPSVIDFPLQQALVNALKSKETWATGLRVLYELLATDFLYGDPHNLVIFADNHDMSRIYTQLDEDMDLLKMAMGILLTTRGIPQLYYGVEVLHKNPGTEDHGVIRTDFPGGWQGDAVNGFTGKGLTAEQRSFQSYLKGLLNWRKDSLAVTTGNFTQYAPENGIYVYFRHKDDDTVMVIVNKNQTSTELPLARFNRFLAGYREVNNAITNKKTMIADTLAVDGKSVQILQLR